MTERNSMRIFDHRTNKLGSEEKIMHHYSPHYQMPYYHSHQYPISQFPQYPQSEIIAHQFKQPLYPHLKSQTLNTIAPFVTYGLKEAQHTSFEHALTEVAAMTYLIGMGIDPQTAYAIVESWEINEAF
jgi:hypothetical protein